jgi:hypothetical protein
MAIKISKEVDKLFTYEDFINYYTNTLGLKLDTSKRQEKNGTISFFDPIANCWYNFYRNGYFRRLYLSGYRWNKGQKMMYPLNRRETCPAEWYGGVKYYPSGSYIKYKTPEGYTDYMRMMKECVGRIEKYRKQPWIQKSIKDKLGINGEMNVQLK